MAETALGGLSVMTTGLGDEADLSVFENKSGLAEDLKFLASMPELCDVYKKKVEFSLFHFSHIFFLLLNICRLHSSQEIRASPSAPLRPSWPPEAGNFLLEIILLSIILISLFRVFQKMLYTAPSPQRKKEPSTGPNKLRLFLKRSSEPLLNLQNPTEKVYIALVPTLHQDVRLINPCALLKCLILRYREDIQHNQLPFPRYAVVVYATKSRTLFLNLNPVV